MSIDNFNVHELNNKQMKNVNGGGWMAYALGWTIGAMSFAGKGLESSGFNGAGANK
jgi:bacteriocin-like protein